LTSGKRWNEGWIVLVNLSQAGAKVSAANRALFGRLMLSDLWTAAQERGNPGDAAKIRPFYLYVDEFQTFITPALAENLDQAMYSTKVMGYREEERETTTQTHSGTRGSGRSEGENVGSSISRPIAQFRLRARQPVGARVPQQQRQ
jgi:hypothetical protein